jgi:hypothetical protein
MVRVWAAADGYLPGQTPHDAGRWTAQIAKSTVAEQVDGSLEQDTAWILKSPFLQAAIDSRHQERQAESVENARADVASVFDAFPELTTAEADEAAKREKSEYFASQIARNQESPVVLVSIEEHLAAKLARATAIARTRQLRVTQFEKTDDSQGKKPEMRNPYLAEQPFAKGMERPSGYRADQAA